MRIKNFLSLGLACACAFSVLTGCGSSGTAGETGAQTTTTTASTTENSNHPVITMNAPYRNAATFYDLVHEKYPEVNLEITPYNGQNMTSYYRDMRESGNMPDIYISTIYFPGRTDDAADLLDLSGYDFTGNYTQSRLREVTNNGAIYMLPLGYNALGITYNKTLLEKNGWTLPTNLPMIPI
ncbi:extracellular solute-binding protein [Gemmiger sp.]